MTNNIGISRPGFALGWFLQNSEVSDADLCGLLLRDYARPLELLARALEPSPPRQLRIADDSLAWALANRAAYRGQVSGAAWLFAAGLRSALGGLALPGPAARRLAEAARRFVQPLDPDEHWSAVLSGLEPEQALFGLGQYGLGLMAEEQAHVFGAPEVQVQAGLDAVRLRLKDHLDTCPACRDQYARLSDLEAGLRARYAATPPLLNRDGSTLQRWQGALLRRAHAAAARKRTRTAALYALQAGLLLVVVAGLFLTARRSLPQGLGDLAQIGPATISLPRTTAPPAPTATRVPTLPAQTPELAAALQLSRDSRSRWKTLWADVRVVRYGAPVGEVMASQVIRLQTWIRQPSSSRVIAGPLAGGPTSTAVMNAGRLRGMNMTTGALFEDESTQVVHDQDLRQLFFPEDADYQGGEYRLAGREHIAGRPAWVIDWYAGSIWYYRFWVDAQYGLLLRRQALSAEFPGELISDVTVNAIYVDAEISPAIFQLQGYDALYFARGPSGVPELPDFAAIAANLPAQNLAPINAASLRPSAQTPPGPDFYPGSLSFQNMATSEDGVRLAIELYAGGYPLGKLPLAGSSILSCQRSADRSLIAYASGPAWAGTSLYLADLRAVQAGKPVLPAGVTAGDYAFSPDSQRLAFFGCEQESAFCGLFILDIPSGQLSKVLPLAYADYIFWKPDGKSLALVGMQARTDVFDRLRSENLLMSELMGLTRLWYFLVVDPASGGIEYRREFDWEALSVPSDSPTMDWGRVVKERASGLESCTRQAQVN